MAHQGTAAFNIKGSTLCSTLKLRGYSNDAFNARYVSILKSRSGPNVLKKLQERFRDVHLIIIDEYSVIPCGMLYWIDQRLREIFPRFRSVPFGGRDVILAGDGGQLSPVNPTSLNVQLCNISKPVQRMGRALWEGMHHVCYLKSQNRGKDDPKWFDALRRLQRKEVTRNDVEMFNSRCIDRIGVPSWSLQAKHVAYTNAAVNAANTFGIEHSETPVVEIDVQHRVQHKSLKIARPIPETARNTLLKIAAEPHKQRDKKLPPGLKLAVGAPVTLTQNIEQKAGLCNGTQGVVYDCMYKPDCPIPIVLVKLTEKYLGPSFVEGVDAVVPIVPHKMTWGASNDDLQTSRLGLPLRLAYAMTIHKVQGLTCPKVVFHSENVPESTFAYVALSRVTHRANVAVTAKLSYEKLKGTGKQDAFIQESERLQELAATCRSASTNLVQEMQTIAREYNTSQGTRL